mmetsp:Transcript_16218/g.41972  ORF Transcript_16218/g.41972 Transcript_16218/m.41972 type:complete len:579 (-) Transcript_16218:649-2385(-)
MCRRRRHAARLHCAPSRCSGTNHYHGMGRVMWIVENAVLHADSTINRHHGRSPPVNFDPSGSVRGLDVWRRHDRELAILGARLLPQPREERSPVHVLVEQDVASLLVDMGGFELDVPRVLRHDRLDDDLAEHLLAPTLADADLVRGDHEVVRDRRRDDRVAQVIGVRGDELAHPRRVGEERPIGTHRNQLHVPVDLVARGRVAVDGLDVRLHDRQQSGKVRALAVEDLGDGHLLVLKVVVHVALAPLRLDHVRVVIRRVRAVGLDEVLAEVELLSAHAIARVRALHVGVDLGDRQEQVEVEGEDRAREQHDDHRERRVLEVRQLRLHRPELRAPADLRVHGRGRLPAHRVPVGGLEVLEVLGLDLVVDVDALAEDHERVAREVVRHVLPQRRVDPRLVQELLDLGLHLHAEIAELLHRVGLARHARGGAVVDVVRDRAVPRLGHAANALAGQLGLPRRVVHRLSLGAPLGGRAIVHRLGDRVPSRVSVDEAAAEDGGARGEREHDGCEHGELIGQEARLVHVVRLQRHLQAARAHPKRHRIPVHVRPCGRAVRRVGGRGLRELGRRNVFVQRGPDVHV